MPSSGPSPETPVWIPGIVSAFLGLVTGDVWTASRAGPRRVQSWPFSGEALAPLIQAHKAPHVVPPLYLTGTSPHYGTVACGRCGDGPLLGDPRGTESPKYVVTNLEDLEVKPQIYPFGDLG